MRLAGKSAVITGGAKGIGRAIAETFAREGCRVLVADLDAAAANETVAAIEAAGGQAVPGVVDVSDEGAVETLVQSATERFGGLDVMVNNAGVPAGPWRTTIEVNLAGVAYGLRHAAAVMAQQGHGSIVSTASILGMIGVGAPADTGADAYVAAKHGVIGLTREYARRYRGAGVRVNCVCPGWIATEMIRHLMDDPAWSERITGRTALRRIGRSEEVAGVFLYLASDESSFVTGASLVVDGGLTAGG